MQAWGHELNYNQDNYNYDQTYYNGSDMGHIGHWNMMLENGSDNAGDIQIMINKTEKSIGKRYVLTGTTSKKPITLQNKYAELTSDDYDDDGDDDGSANYNGEDFDSDKIHTRHRFNKRQRQRRREQLMTSRHTDTTSKNSQHMRLGHDSQSWHPGPEHSGDIMRLRHNNDSAQHNVVNVDVANRDGCQHVVQDAETPNGHGTHCNCSSKWSPNCSFIFSCERVNPQEWASHGDEVQGLEALDEESPVAKLLGAEFQVENCSPGRPDAGSPTRGPPHPRTVLSGGYPYGTCASGVYPGAHEEHDVPPASYEDISSTAWRLPAGIRARWWYPTRHDSSWPS